VLWGFMHRSCGFCDAFMMVLVGWDGWITSRIPASAVSILKVSFYDSLMSTLQRYETHNRQHGIARL